MSKKVLILGLFVALLASTVGGALDASARSYPSNGLYCTPDVQYVQSGELVTLTAGYIYPSFYEGDFTWQAVGGRPSSGTGSSFSTRFRTSSINQTSVVTVTDGYQTASCTVFIYGPQPTWTPTPTPSFPTLHCSPSRAYASNGEYVTFSATGGNGSYSWTAVDGNPSYGYGSVFTSQFFNYTSHQKSYFVTVTSNDWYYGDRSTTCEVRVSPYSNPTPTVSPTWFSMDHSVRDITRGTQGTSVTAHDGDRLQFTTRITIGDSYAQDVHVRDWLPQYVNYIPGTTTVDGSWYQDGIATGNSNDSLALGDLSPNRTYVVRFEANVNGAPNVTLTNSVNVHVRGVSDQNRTSTIRVVGSYVTPTPTWTWTPTPYPGNGTISLGLTGRNVSRGQTGEYSSLVGRGNETLQVLLHIRNTSGSTVYNVFVTDVLPGGLRYVNSSTSINGILTNDALTSTGLNIGTLVAGQEAVVRFDAVIDPAVVPTLGQVDLSDNAQARADSVTTVSARLPIVLGENASIAAISRIKTGPADTVLLALLASIVVTGLYAMYTNTALFGRRMAMSEIARTVGRTADMNFIG